MKSRHLQVNPSCSSSSFFLSSHPSTPPSFIENVDSNVQLRSPPPTLNPLHGMLSSPSPLSSTLIIIIIVLPLSIHSHFTHSPLSINTHTYPDPITSTPEVIISRPTEDNDPAIAQSTRCKKPPPKKKNLKPAAQQSGRPM
jgi:hypothetical protein